MHAYIHMYVITYTRASENIYIRINKTARFLVNK